MVTVEQFEELFYRDPDGIRIYWKVNQGSAQVGDEAGSITGGGYVYIVINRVAHRRANLNWLLYTGKWLKRGYLLDHKDQDKLNDHISNLREVQYGDNNKNYPMLCTNTSGHTGISIRETKTKGTRYVASICADCTPIQIGTFDTFEEAVSARKEAEKQYGFHPNHGN